MGLRLRVQVEDVGFGFAVQGRGVMVGEVITAAGGGRVDEAGMKTATTKEPGPQRDEDVFTFAQPHEHRRTLRSRQHSSEGLPKTLCTIISNTSTCAISEIRA